MNVNATSTVNGKLTVGITRFSSTDEYGRTETFVFNNGHIFYHEIFEPVGSSRANRAREVLFDDDGPYWSEWFPIDATGERIFGEWYDHDFNHIEV